MADLKGELERIGSRVRERFEAEKRVLSFSEYLDEFAAHPWRHSRDAARYVRDCFAHYGTYEVVRPWAKLTRFRLFDLEFERLEDEAAYDHLVGHEQIQGAFYRALENFVREGRANRLVLLHGPNGSAKSTFAQCVMRGLEDYSKRPEGALYRFSWVFPRGTDGKTIGFGSRDEGPRPGETYAHLGEGRVDVKLRGSLREHPLLLLPIEERDRLVRRVYTEHAISDAPPHGILRGQLGQKNRQVFEALLTAYRGDLSRVLAHVQVERYTISRRYRTGAVTIGPQMAVDASERQITADTSLSALPASLTSLTLFEPYGELVDATGGLVEYSDLLKRPLDAWKYLLLAIETGEVSLTFSTLPINSVMLASSNELHLAAFKEHPDYHSFRGRIQLVKVPYLRDYRQEQGIYQTQIAPQVRVHVAPHAMYVAALWATLTRLRKPASDGFADGKLGQLAADLTPLEKAELYSDGQTPKRLSADDALRLKNGIAEIFAEAEAGQVYEGLTGASPREMRTLLLDAAQHPEFSCLSPLAVLACIRTLCKAGEYGFLREAPAAGYQDHASFVEQVRERWLDRVDVEFRDSTGLVEEGRYADLFDRYITHVSHAIKHERVFNRVTGITEDPDRDMMASVEKTLGAGANVESFRRTLINTIAGYAIDHPGVKVEYAVVFPRHFERLKEAYFSDRVKQLREIGDDILRVVANERDHDLAQENVELARRAYDTLRSRYGYEASSVRDALGELLTRRYQV
jgi:predicted Ser/Thr protein kinase